MTKFYVIWGTRTTAAYFYLKLNGIIVYLAWATLGVIFGVAVVSHFTVLQLEVNLNSKEWRRNPPDVGVTSGQKPSTKIIYIVLQTSVGLF